MRRRRITTRGPQPRALAATLAVWLPLLLAAPLGSAGADAGEGGRYRLRVNGLVCPFCAYGIEKKLGELEGVTSIEVRLDEGAVLVRTRAGTTITEERARRAVNAAGFDLQGFQVLEPAESAAAGPTAPGRARAP